MDDLDKEIAQSEALLQVSSRFENESIVKDYEERIEKMAKLQNEISSLEKTTADLRSQSDVLRDEWSSDLERHVSTINQNFVRFVRSIGFDGRVSISKGPEYSKWELMLEISFNKDEPLQRLSHLRQSGGEKSLTTILYLLALQELSVCPIRIVDEINQGMDEANERKAHELIVNVSSNSKSIQFFMISPKLLEGLAYRREVEVLCIYSNV